MGLCSYVSFVDVIPPTTIVHVQMALPTRLVKQNVTADGAGEGVAPDAEEEYEEDGDSRTGKYAVFWCIYKWGARMAALLLLCRRPCRLHLR